MINIVTDYPVALDSPDHIQPVGTAKDNTRNPKYLDKVAMLIDDGARILDIGCAGGGCIEDFVNRGYDAYGIEGSDYSKKLGRASWGKIPKRLMTCDASRPFSFEEDISPVLFDLVQSFEVIEHIKTSRLNVFMANIYKHLKQGGYFIGTFTCVPEPKGNLDINHHQTVWTKEQWKDFFSSLDDMEIVDLDWEPKDYLRSSSIPTHCIPICLRKRS